jgi:Mn2+/Fe2+ NRAMP family transporter
LAGVSGSRRRESNGSAHACAAAGATRREVIDRNLDVGIGTFFSNFVMYFIILTTALTLHKQGITNIDSSKQAAETLRPLAGTLAWLL